MHTLLYSRLLTFMFGVSGSQSSIELVEQYRKTIERLHNNT